MQIGYLGPKGTFTEKAAIFYSPQDKRIPYQSIDDVIEAVDNNTIDIGIVPIENSIEGMVNATMDMLIFYSNVKILREIVIPININFLVSKDYNRENITEILSHPQALGQCRKFLNKFYHDSKQIATSSTSEAAKMILNKNCAALGNSLCAELYNLKALHTNVQDNKTNETRFIVISKQSELVITPECKTSIAFSVPNEPGALYKVLNILALWDMNMTKIVSRPMKNNIGQYGFFVELEGNITNEDMQDAICMIQRKTLFYKLFGSYPVFTKVG